MEINDINKVACRKRINSEVEKLREKVSRETAKIIKLKVGQDTAYWDLKEKLQQVEGNHERLQQNMVEVQMQHEALSARHLDELRHRPETLNKLSSTREICGVLQDYSERLKETLARCKADQAALCDAYQRSGQLVRDIRDSHLRASDKDRQLVVALEDKVKLTSDHQNQLLQLFTAFKQQADADMADLRAKLETESAQKNELLGTISKLTRSNDDYKFDLARREETISNLERDMKQLTEDFNTQRAEQRNNLQIREKELKDALNENESLKQALANHEQYTKTISDQNELLQEKVAALEQEHRTAAALIQDMKTKVQDATNIFDNLKKDMALQVEEKERYLVELKDKEQTIISFNSEIEQLREQIVVRENEKCSILVNLENCTVESNKLSVRIDELNLEVAARATKSEQLENTFNDYRTTTEAKINELLKTIESKDKELDSKAGAITQLMSEIKTGTDVRSKLETSLQKLKKETEAERESEKEKLAKMATKIDNLEASVKDKEESVAKQMSLIYEMRGEKERLQSKISSMQNTIDNIQKELTGRPLPAPQPDHDDNAVMLTPAHKKVAPSSPLVQKTSEFLVPRAEPKQLDNMLFNLFSDSSMEGDTIDASEVNRRFNAISRGERVSPRPLASLKRRTGVPALQGGLKFKAMHDESAVSLSQVKSDLKNKDRSFFKNKRNDAKIRRHK